MYNKKQSTKPLLYNSVGHDKNLSITFRSQVLPVHAACGLPKEDLHKLLPEQWVAA